MSNELKAVDRLLTYIRVLEGEERFIQDALGYVLAEDIHLPADVPLLLHRGTELRPGHLGLLASSGLPRVPVVRRPTVAILAIGSELTQPGRHLPRSQVYDSNAYCLAGQTILAGGVPMLLGTAPDDEKALRQKVYQGLSADFIVTSGGTSRGDYDLVRKALAETEPAFQAAKIKLGKSITFGVFVKEGSTVPYMGLPGNPVGCMINFELFARPVILKMRGKHDWTRSLVSATLTETVSNPHGVEKHALVKVEQRGGLYYAHPIPSHDYGAPTTMLSANGVAIIPGDVVCVEAGNEVQVMMLAWQDLNLTYPLAVSSRESASQIGLSG